MEVDQRRLFGRPTPRVDGVAKVTGAARYASDEAVARPAYAYLVTSAIARGRITAMGLDRAAAVPGVLDILHHGNVGGETALQPSTPSLETNQIWHDGQIIAVVVAETFEAAREAAMKVDVDYAPEPPSAGFGSAGVVEQPNPPGKDPKVGDAGAALALADVKIEARYQTPTQHHNALELFTTTCVWDGPKLTIYEPSQFMYGLKAALARQLKIDPANVRTVSKFVGGAFGGKAGPTARTVWVAIAARRLGRPVKLVASREQGFTIATYRAETRHRIRLGATAEGRLTALIHEGWEVSSRPSDYNVAGVETTARMYACANVETAVTVVHADRSTPGFMRAPGETPYMFALESAMDELAIALKMDPVELRRINDAKTDPVNGKAFSSRSLVACFDAAAARFGWSARSPAPGSMREGDWLIGWGCASACYPSNVVSCAARLSVTPAGRAMVQLAGHEIGNGAYTAIALTAADALGLPIEAVTVQLGDSDLPPVPVAGGSNNTASTINVVMKGCNEVRERLAAAAVADPAGPFLGVDKANLRLVDGRLTDGLHAEPLSKALGRVTGGVLEVLAEYVPAGLPPTAMGLLYKGVPVFLPGATRKDMTAYAFGAHFVEVRVHALTREIRTPRMVSAFAAGTIVNPTAAHSQFMGGAIWGLSSALHEATEIDPRTARYVNENLADYRVPVNADVPAIEVIIVPEPGDESNPLGIKGIGEIGIVGVNAAVANAVHHATGVRVRNLPILAENLI
jgi:xanthine dehydrogenase YagR molybdenum-binding subunit